VAGGEQAAGEVNGAFGLGITRHRVWGGHAAGVHSWNLGVPRHGHFPLVAGAFAFVTLVVGRAAVLSVVTAYGLRDEGNKVDVA